MAKCKHENFLRTSTVNREDGKVDWVGKCQDCNEPLTLKGVFMKGVSEKHGPNAELEVVVKAVEL